MTQVGGICVPLDTLSSYSMKAYVVGTHWKCLGMGLSVLVG